MARPRLSFATARRQHLSRALLSPQPLGRSPFRTISRLTSTSASASTPTAPDAAPASPLLATLRADLKTALRAKDKERLLVIRSVLADVTDASKTSKPITTDLQVLAIVRKKLSGARTAIAEAEDAGRSDLVAREQGQAALLEEYAARVETWEDDRVAAVLGQVLASLGGGAGGTQKVAVGDVLKRVFAAGGELDGKPVERGRVAALVKELVGKQS